MSQSRQATRRQLLRAACIVSASVLLIALRWMGAGTGLRAEDNAGDNGTLPGVSKSYLPFIRIDPTPTPAPTPFPSLVNGDFEQGPGAGWTESLPPLVVPVARIPAAVRAGASGNYVAWLAGSSESPSRLSQPLLIPYVYGNSLRLRLQAYTASDESRCIYDRAYVYVDASTTPLLTFPLCSGKATNGWQQYAADLTGYGGKRVELRFETMVGGSRNSHWFVDNVELCQAGAPGC